MAINPHIPINPSNSPLRAKQERRVGQADFHLPEDNTSPGESMERATREFGLALQQLSDADKQEIQKIQNMVDQKHRGQSAERFGRFLVGIMDYSHRRLNYIQQNPGSAAPGECENLERVFKNGMVLVETFTQLN